ncbi:MAG: hypothetical protein IPO05_02870 [Flavobacteriales bacterium]|nr:hypothetical protein [Flavobacteriales bacterium]
MKRTGITVEVDAAAEYYLDHELSPRWRGRMCHLRENFVLFELPFIGEPAMVRQLVFQMQTQGYRPVLAHPERYTFWHNDLTKIQKFPRTGVCSSS